MNPLKPLMKRLVLIYVLAVALVTLYFILRLLFPQEKSPVLRHFNTEAVAVEHIQHDKEKQTSNEKQAQQTFMLLPQN